MNVERSIQAQLAQLGLTLPTNFTLGELIRVSALGDRGGERSGWLVARADGSMTAGNWKTGEQVSTQPETSLTYGEQTELRERIAEAQEQRQKAKALSQYEAAETANEYWNNAFPVDVFHPYLLSKSLDVSLAGAVRQAASGHLLIPVHDESNQLWSLQSISNIGEKRFMPNGKKQGNFCLLSGSTEVVYVCEGWATGQSIFASTGASVFVCFDAGNIESVTRQIKHRHQRIVIAADNDKRGDFNIGVSRAKATAQMWALEVAIPTLGKNKCDFNDVYRALGADAVAKQLSETKTFKD